MGRLVLKMSLSLDGFVGGPAGEIDWIFHSFNDETSAWTMATLAEADVHIMGSRTFADMAAWWPTSSQPFAAPMNAIPKVVFSRRGPAATTPALADSARARAARGEIEVPPSSAAAASWQNAGVASGDLAAELSALKQRHGFVLAHGGAAFAQSLVVSGAIDEYRLLIHPAALGRGLSLFGALTQILSLRLIASTRFATGTVAMVYQPA